MKLFNLITTFLGLAAALLTGLKLVPSTEVDAVPQVTRSEDVTTEKRNDVCAYKCKEQADDLQECRYIPYCASGSGYTQRLKLYDNCCKIARKVRSEGTIVESVDTEPAAAGDPAGSPADYVDPTGGKAERV